MSGVEYLQESEYRIHRLRESISEYAGKQLAIYGTGDNARLILERLGCDQFVCLIDENHVGEYFYGKLVVSLKEICVIGIDAVVIAAISSSSILVEQRIIDFCIDHSIDLLDMYGCDLIERKRLYLQSKLAYMSLDEKSVVNTISEHDVVCIELFSCLIEDVSGDCICRDKYLLKLS